MKPVDDLSVEFLRNRFSYNKRTGLLRYKRSGHKHRKGDIVGWPRGGQYIVLKIRHRAYYAQRIIWAIVTGSWPDGEVDHKNTIKTDNKWKNLRLATRFQNIANRPGPRGISGLKGAWRNSRGGNWTSTITINGARIRLGTFQTKEEAHAAYSRRAVAAFGEFARLS